MPADAAQLDQMNPVIEGLQPLLDRQRRAFQENPYPQTDERVQWLDALHRLIANNRPVLIEAVSADFGNRSADETLLAEIMPSLQAIHHATRHLRKWMKPARRSVGLAFQPASARVLYQQIGRAHV